MATGTRRRRRVRSSRGYGLYDAFELTLRRMIEGSIQLIIVRIPHFILIQGPRSGLEVVRELPCHAVRAVRLGSMALLWLLIVTGPALALSLSQPAVRGWLNAELRTSGEHLRAVDLSSIQLRIQEGTVIFLAASAAGLWALLAIAGAARSLRKDRSGPSYRLSHELSVWHEPDEPSEATRKAIEPTGQSQRGIA